MRYPKQQPPPVEPPLNPWGPPTIYFYGSKIVTLATVTSVTGSEQGPEEQ